MRPTLYRCAPHRSHSVSRHRLVAMLCSVNSKLSVGTLRNTVRNAPNASGALERPNVSLVERAAPLIVPNRPDERSATHGLKHGGLRAPASIDRGRRDLAAERRRSEGSRSRYADPTKTRHAASGRRRTSRRRVAGRTAPTTRVHVMEPEGSVVTSGPRGR